MTINRRDILIGGSALLAVGSSPRQAAAQAPAAQLLDPKPGAWRTFEVKTVVEIAETKGAAQAWLPIPAFEGAGWIKPGSTDWSIAGGTARIVRDPKSGAVMAHASWGETGAPRAVEVVSRFSGRDRAVDLQGAGGPAANLGAQQRTLYTAATALQPTDGIVKATADRIVGEARAERDLDKVRAIYEWIVDNTFRNPKTRGCGTGDIASMLHTGNLSGKCADLNALFVGLVRAAGIPARDVYGIRVAPSAFGYKSLGANSATITKAQHCRAEVFIAGLGWIAADPADVRKVVLEEPPGNLALGDARVAAARKALLGAWETNWLAYNDAHDVVLPGSSGPPVAFLMYPQAETIAGRLDSLDPDAFKYVISAREITA